jgi:hypothetical protein
VTYSKYLEFLTWRDPLLKSCFCELFEIPDAGSVLRAISINRLYLNNDDLFLCSGILWRLKQCRAFRAHIRAVVFYFIQSPRRG